MDVHSTLSRRVLAAVGVLVVVWLIVSAVFSVPRPLTGDYATGAIATLGLVVVAVAVATVAGLLGGSGRSTTYW